MNHHLCTTLPITDTQLQPHVPDFATIKAKEEEKKELFDSRHAVRDLDPLLPGEHVWIQDHNTEERVVEPAAP